jgi:hypothetical protein
MTEEQMAPDYPAAHSMDTVWFAVDGQGYVAMFYSGENGHVPDNMAASQEDLTDRLWVLFTGEDVEAWLELGSQEAARRIGLFYFDHDGSFAPIGPYHRDKEPDAPLHVDQLPPAIRNSCKGLQFEKVVFAESELLQPLDYFACVFWYEESRVAYLAIDGKTVRPVPGKEDKFQEFIEEFRKENPEQAKDYQVEGIDE